MGINRRDFIKLFGLGGVGFYLNPQIEFPEIQQPLNDDFDATLNYALIDIGMVETYKFLSDTDFDVIFRSNMLKDMPFSVVDTSKIFSLTGLIQSGTDVIRFWFFKVRMVALCHNPYNLPSSLEIRAYLDETKPLNQSIGYMVVETDTRPPINEFDGISHMINVK